MSKGRRRLLGLIAITPAILAVIASRVGGWRYSAGVEAGAYLFLGVGSAFVVAALALGRMPADRRMMSLFIWKIDTVKHRRPVALVFALVGAFVFWVAANDIGDWLVPPDTRSVVIDRSRESIRTGVTSIYTDVGNFEGPWFVSFEVQPGPALLTLGHFSGHVLAVDQDP